MVAAPRLPGFEYHRVEVDGVGINTAIGGSGPPVLLLHGYPQNHLMWRPVVAELACHHTVVATDLRGYGDSDKPAPRDDDSTYAKRAMAADQVAVMGELGFDRFALVGHDRGARVAHRLALDHADAVSRLAVLDIVPTRHVFHHTDRVLASAYFHWFFLSTSGGVPEAMIGHDPEFWLRTMVGRLLGPGGRLDDDLMADYVRTFSSPEAIAASCADYRSATTVDLEHDDASAEAGERITAPVLVLWGERGFVGRTYEPVDVWREYADDVRGTELPCGHFLPEEAPEPVIAELRRFLDD